MKKITIVILALVLLILPVAADSDFGSFGITGGYTSKDNTALLGFYGTYQYGAEVSSVLNIGLGSHADFEFGVNHDNVLSVFFGSLLGMGMDIRPMDSMAINITLGPALVVETGETTASIGIGIGLDTAFSYYFDVNKSVGVTVGATVYPQFFVIDDGRSSNFSIASLAYVGMSFRFPSPAAFIALPVIDYLL